MRSRLLSALVLLAGAGLARADYMVIIANLNPSGDDRALASGPGGFAPGGAGPGMGMPGPGMGMPGGGFRGSGSAPGGMGPAGPGGGFRGGAPGMMGPGGFREGMMGPGGGGFRGGMPGGTMGEGGGMAGGMMGMMMGGAGTGVDAIDDAPFYAVAVIEIQHLNKQQLVNFKRGQQMIFSHPSWGKAWLHPQTAYYEAIPLETSSGVMLPSVR